MAFIGAAFLRHAWPSYLLVLLLQLKLLWRMWDLKDITFGDTASYFITAGHWLDGFRVDMAWSPLYTAFYGSFLFVTRDPYAATILHRLVIILLISTLVLFLLRSILPPALALLGAVWWAVVPTFYNNIYEVHLFALLPVLLAWILIIRWDSPWARGTAVAVLAASAILVRNELGIAAGLTALMCLVYEYYQTGSAPAMKRHILGYGIPLACAIVLCLLAYWRSILHFPELSGELEFKHTLNMCQVFAFGFQQRSSAWVGNPWLDCQTLMRETFGTGLPSFAEMLESNPAAVMRHLLWNLSLIPNGLQLLLFGAMYGRVNPDYTAVVQAPYPLFLLPILIVVPLAAAWEARHDFYKRSAQWIRNRIPLLIAFLPMLAVALIVALVQRPRPSYLFYITIIVIVLFMESVGALLRERPTWTRALNVVAPPVALLLIVGLPSYYVENPSTRPLKTKIERVAPQRDAMVATDGRLLLGAYGSNVAMYLRIPKTAADPRYDRPGVVESLQGWDRSIPLARWLADEQFQFVFFDPEIVQELRKTPSAAPLLNDPASVGWTTLAYEGIGGESWIFLSTTDAALSIAQPFWTDGAYPVEVFHGERFRWLRRSAKLALPLGTECVAFRIFGTNRSDPSQIVRIRGNNIVPVELNLAGTNIVNQLAIRIPIRNPSAGADLTLDADIPETTFPDDPRSIAFGATALKRISLRDCQ